MDRGGAVFDMTHRVPTDANYGVAIASKGRICVTAFVLDFKLGHLDNIVCVWPIDCVCMCIL